ncbi:MAG: DUF1440 domain-containing protein [Bryobacterales bacterium]|nr:DUF1440 domain-containing protein [Bryobacterales bacterium]MBV9397832.1 DUF1440 domain-containing protein [Bryobacterales bacterium]
MRITLRRRRRSAWKDVAAGALGGLAGTAAMSGFQALWKTKSQNGRQENNPSDEPATVKAARAVLQTVIRHELPESKKALASNAVHYAVGALSGAAYGGIAHKLRPAGAGRGALFGVGLWALADNILVPALKLSKPLTEYPPSTHMYGLASHLVYGLAADRTAKLVRGWL